MNAEGYLYDTPEECFPEANIISLYAELISDGKPETIDYILADLIYSNNFEFLLFLSFQKPPELKITPLPHDTFHRPRLFLDSPLSSGIPGLQAGMSGYEFHRTRRPELTLRELIAQANFPTKSFPLDLPIMSAHRHEVIFTRGQPNPLK